MASHWQKTKLKRVKGSRKTELESRFDIKTVDDSIPSETDVPNTSKPNPKPSKRD